LSIRGIDEKPSDKDLVALRLFAETLTQVPAVIPRSPQAILELRQQLKEELEEFRNGVKYGATDLLQESDPPTQAKIQHIVETRFVRPLDKLNRRLAHPNKELLRNLVSTNSVVASGLTFGLTLLTGGTGLLAAFLGAVAPLFTTALKTKFDRDKAIDESGVGFLIRARQTSD
jgi:hypothetical protein